MTRRSPWIEHDAVGERVAHRLERSCEVPVHRSSGAEFRTASRTIVTVAMRDAGANSASRARRRSARADRRRGPSSPPTQRRFTLAEVRARLADLAAGGRAGPERRRQPGRGGARAAVRGRRRDPRRAHQAARDDVVAPGRDRVPGRQVRTRRRRRPARRRRCARRTRRSGSTRGASRSWRASTGSARSRRGSRSRRSSGSSAGRPRSTPNPAEVVRVLEVPLSELLDPDVVPRGALGHASTRRLRRALLRPRRRDRVGRDRAHPHQLPHPSRRRPLTARRRLSTAVDGRRTTRSGT